MHRFFPIVLIAFLAGSCRDTTAVKDPPAPVDHVRVFAESRLAGLPEDLLARAEALAAGAEVKSLLDREASRSWNARLDGGIKYADLFQDIYAARKYRKVFAHPAGMKPRGATALEVLRAADRHALIPADYHIARIDALVDGLAVEAPERPTSTLALEGQEAEAVVRWFREHGTGNPDADYDALVETVVTASPSPLPRISAEIAAHRDAFARTAKDTAELELRLADGVLRYARDMRHFNLNRDDWRVIKDAGGSKALIYSRLRTTYDAMAAAEDIASILEGLEPQHPQYDKIVAAHLRYREIVASGGWPRVASVDVAVGDKGPRVEALWDRLAREGYLPNKRAEQLAADDTLIAALDAFAVAHQFRPGSRDAGLLRSMNIPAERRLEQIVLTLQRWRESRYDNESDYVFVNIPDFHAEVYKDHQRDMRFRVVVGNTERKCDPATKKWVMPNATPVQRAEMDHLILNPFWNVPERIVAEELNPKIKKDPDYLEKNNYEIVKNPKGNTWIRQKPGDDNALGRVKFIFPNRHNTYMHDTPKKKYFDYAVRAFSHGCVRVHQPLDLAKYLLEKEGLATAQEVDTLIASGEQRKYVLRNKLPVFFEYYVVRVDDDGHANFLADVYRLDQLRENEDDADALSCNHRPKPSIDNDGETSTPSDVAGDLGP